MRLATFLAPGATEPQAGEVRDARVIAFADPATTVVGRLASGDRAPADGAEHALADVRLLAPVQPRAVFGIGLNYAAHAAETGAEPPAVPIVFPKLPSSVVGGFGTLSIPAAAKGRLDYEGELGVVLGPAGTVGGYLVCDDLSARDLQRAETQWTRAKGFDSSCPCGPWLTTADEVADPEDLALRTWVNGGLRQDARTNDLIFGISELVAFLSQVITLEPGDLILTGTPSGVGQAMDPPGLLCDGDVVRIEIEELGTIEHAIG